MDSEISFLEKRNTNRHILNNRPPGLFFEKTQERGDGWGKKAEEKRLDYNTTPHAIARSRVGSCSELDLRLLWDFTSSTTTVLALSCWMELELGKMKGRSRELFKH